MNRFSSATRTCPDARRRTGHRFIAVAERTTRHDARGHPDASCTPVQQRPSIVGVHIEGDRRAEKHAADTRDAVGLDPWGDASVAVVGERHTGSELAAVPSAGTSRTACNPAGDVQHAVFRSAFDQHDLSASLDRAHATVLFGVPSIHRRLMALEDDELRSLRRLRRVISGSAPLTMACPNSSASVRGSRRLSAMD